MSSVRSCWRSCWCLLALALCATAASARRLHEARSALAVTLMDVAVAPDSSTWVPTISTDQAVAIVGVEGSGAAPARVRYTVSFALNVTYVLTGSVAISSTGTEPGAQAAQAAPSVTITPASGAAFLLPPSAVVCPSLEVPAGGSAACTFRAPLQAAAGGPPSGTVKATLQTRDGPVPSQPAPYSAQEAQGQQAPDITITNFFEPGSPEQPNVLPVGVDGVQPPAGTHISRGTTYEYTAVLGSLPQSKCGQEGLQVVNTATVRGAAPGGGDVTAVNTVAVAVAGCGRDAAALRQAPADAAASGSSTNGAGGPASFTSYGGATASSASFLAVDAAPVEPNCGGRCNPQTQQCDPTTSMCCAIGAVVPAGGCCPDGQLLDGNNECCPAQLMCGRPGSQACCRAPNTCMDGRQCVHLGAAVLQEFMPQQTQLLEQQQQLQAATPSCSGDSILVAGACCRTPSVCNGKCCGAGEGCFAGSCCPRERQNTATGQCCAPGEVVVSANTSANAAGQCCDKTRVCGNRCLPAGSACVDGRPCPSSQKCGGTCCASDSVCDSITNTCCKIGGILAGGGCCAPERTCGPSCCSMTEMCLGGRTCCRPEQVCGSTCCEAGTTCLGRTCCPNSQVCGSTCCGSGMACINGRCATPGSIPCGDSFCSAGLLCCGQNCCPPPNPITIVNNNNNDNTALSSSSSSSVSGSMGGQQWNRNYGWNDY